MFNLSSFQVGVGQPVASTGAPEPGTGPGGLAGWIYAVIAIAVVGLILIILLIGVILAVRRRDKPRNK